VTDDPGQDLQDIQDCGWHNSNLVNPVNPVYFCSSMIQKDSPETRSDAGRIVADGGVIAFRTDTFYGLGADPFDRNAVRRIWGLKGREEGKPILVLIADMNEADRFFDQYEAVKAVAVGHWPAPLTLISVARPDLPIELTAGTNSIGVRLPDHENVRALVRVCGGALTATSANPSGQAPARTALEVQTYFPTGVDLIIDGGEVEATLPSTVLDLTGPIPHVVREGAVPTSELEDILKR
jgi:L-threonylcarbamoyladenylate synthase